MDLLDEPPGGHLLDGGTVPAYRAAMALAVDHVADAVASADRPSTATSPAVLEDKLADVDLDEPVGDLSGALDELDELYLRDAVYFHHPRYMAHLNCPVALPAVAAEAVQAALNTSVDTWDQSRGATLIEQRLVGWTAARIGFGPDADGVFTSGGTQSNLQALAIAREEVLAREEVPARAPAATGGRGGAAMRILASADAHVSVDKAAQLLGLGPGAVRRVAVDAGHRMRGDALHAELERCRADGDVVLAVVATAGTTDVGAIDPLEAVAEHCAAAGVWLHVDAAYGGGLLVSRRRRELLAGIERADSVTVDYHKSFFQPVSASAVVLHDGTRLRHVTHHAEYLNPRDGRAQDAGRDQVDKSLQTTRRFDALKLWMTLRVMGADAIGELFDTAVDLAGEVGRMLAADPRFELAVDPPLSTLVFRYRPPTELAPERLDRVLRETRHTLFATGQAAVAGTRVDGRYHLKLTLLNPRATLADVADVCERIAEEASRRAEGVAA